MAGARWTARGMAAAATGARAAAAPRARPAGLAAAAALLALVLIGPADARWLFQSKAAAEAPAQLHIAHVNDVHNRIEQTGTSSAACTKAAAKAGTCLGGWARISSAVDAARRKAAAEKAGFLFLDAGDQFDGTLWDVIFKGEATAVLQNIVKPDVMTLGNHEFSFPAENLKNYLGNLTFPVLGACNIDTSKEPLLKGLVQRYEVKEIGPYKIGIVGWITPDTSFTAANVGKVTFSDVNPSVQKCIDDLKKEHPDVHMIIGLSHTGYDQDLETAAKVPELDMIIGGHSHTFLNNPSEGAGPIFDKTAGASADTCIQARACDESEGPYPTYVNTKVCVAAPKGEDAKCSPKKVPVFQAYYASKYLGHILVDLPTKSIASARPILLGGPNSTSPWPQDPKILAAIEKMAAPVRALENKAAGRVAEVMLGGKIGRTQETNFGSYLADLMVKAIRALPVFTKEKGPVDIALVNAGSIRANLEPGAVTYGDVLTALPFKNTLSVKPLSGKQLKEVLEHGISGIEEKEGRFLQVSGIRFWHRGPKLLAAKLLNDNGTTSPIDPDHEYNIVVPDYMANGGDGFFAFKHAPMLLQMGPQFDDLVFKDMEGANASPIVLPDIKAVPRIIDCAAKTVDCSNKELYGPCCPDSKRRSRRRRSAAK